MKNRKDAQQRANLRNAYLVESVDTIRAAMNRQDENGKACLQEMLDECRKYGVENFGQTPF
jgi:hypothetical protein